jgi:hypothetical protein
MRGVDVVIGVLVVVGVIFLGLWFNSAFLAPTVLLQPATTSQVEIGAVTGEIVPCAGDVLFTDGIIFGPGPLDPPFGPDHPGDDGDEPAVGNDDGGGLTQYCIAKGPDATIDVEVCVHAIDADESAGPANGNLQFQPDGPTIPIEGGPLFDPVTEFGETYVFASSADMLTFPSSEEFLTIDLTIDPTPILASNEINDVDNAWYRFWLDVEDPAQPAGIYTNTVVFTVQDPNCVGDACACVTT